MLADKLRAISAASAPASKYARVVTGALTTSGTCDITYSGGGTCDGAIILVSMATALNTDTNHASLSVCFFDGTTAYSAANNSEDNQGRADTQSAISSGLLIGGIDANAQDGAGSVATITDGIRITWSNTPSAAFRYVAVLFFGGVDIKAGYIFPSDTANGTATYSGADFIAQAGLFVYSNVNETFTGSFTTNETAQFHFGAFSFNNSTITQRGFTAYDLDQANIAEIYSEAINTGINIVSGYDSHKVTAVGSTGFTLTTLGPSPDPQYFIFLLIGGITAASLDDTAVPASTGVKSWEGPGFQPSFILSAASGFNTYNSASTKEDINLAIGVHDGTTGGGVAVWCNDAAGTSDTGSRTNSTAFLQSYQTTLAEQFAAQFDSFDSTGYNLDYTEVTSGLLGFTLALQL